MTSELPQFLARFAVQVASMAAWLFILTLVFLPLERWFAVRERVPGQRELARDLAYYVLNSIAPTLLLALPLAALAAAVRQVTPAGVAQLVAGLPLWVKLLAGLAIGDLGAYWGHRLSHRSAFLWGFHKVHHAPEHIAWLVNTRAHPVDVAFTRLCGLAPVYALGLAQTSGAGASQVPVLIGVIGLFWSFFIHANVRWRFGPLEWLIATPAFHHWHHTNDEHRDHNFAALLPVYDRLFGTHHLPRAWPPSYGVDAPPPPTLVGQLLQPMGLGDGAPRRRAPR